MGNLCPHHCPSGGGISLTAAAGGVVVAAGVVLAAGAAYGFLNDYGALVMACAWLLLVVAVVAGVLTVRRLNRRVAVPVAAAERRALPAGAARLAVAARPVAAIEGAVVRDRAPLEFSYQLRGQS